MDIGRNELPLIRIRHDPEQHASPGPRTADERELIPTVLLATLAKRHDDFAAAGVGAEVLVSGGIFPQSIENAIDGGLQGSRG